MIGTLDYETGIFDHGDFFTFDYGFDFYATTMMKNPEGRYFIIAWMAAWQSPFPEQEDGWATILTIPRELQFRDGKLYTVPPKEFEEMRDEGVHYKDLSLDKETKLDGVKGNVGELLVEIDTKKSKKFALELFTDGEEKTVLSYDEDSRVMTLDRDKTGAGGKGIRQAELTPFDILKLRIYLDKSSIEIFVNDGEFVFSTSVYPKAESDNIVFVPQTETLEISSVDFYKFK